MKPKNTKTKHATTQHHKKINFKKKWWLWTILALITIYLINGIVVAFFVYKTYPNSLAEGKKYPDQNKYIAVSSKMYPYVAAWVNWKPIWINDYYKQLGYIRHFSQKTQQQIPENSQLQTQVLDQMIDNELLKQQAAKYKIKVTKDDVNKAYDQIVQENQGDKEVSQILEELYGMKEKDFKQLIKDQLLVQKIQEELVVQVKAKHILIKDEGKAKEILEEVKKGEKSFEDLAKEHSEDTGSRDNGGELGWFGRGMMVKEFEDKAFTMDAGQVSQELVKTEFGYHIIKVEEKKGQIDKAYLDWFNEVKDNSKIYKWINTSEKDTDDANTISPEENKEEEKPAEESKEEN